MGNVREPVVARKTREKVSLSLFERECDLGSVLPRRSTRNLVVDRSAGLIGAGIRQLGDVLAGERDLAGMFRVNRETVRGTIPQLATGGIIEIAQRARTRVVSSDAGATRSGLRAARRVNVFDIEPVHAARLLVELPVVAAAVARIRAATLDFLRESLQAQREAADDPVRFLICDRKFHLTIHRCAGDPALADFISDLYLYVVERRRRAVAQPAAILRSHEDRAAIVEGLERRTRRRWSPRFERISTGSAAPRSASCHRDATATRRVRLEPPRC